MARLLTKGELLNRLGIASPQKRGGGRAEEKSNKKGGVSTPSGHPPPQNTHRPTQGEGRRGKRAPSGGGGTYPPVLPNRRQGNQGLQGQPGAKEGTQARSP